MNIAAGSYSGTFPVGAAKYLKLTTSDSVDLTIQGSKNGGQTFEDITSLVFGSGGGVSTGISLGGAAFYRIKNNGGSLVSVTVDASAAPPEPTNIGTQFIALSASDAVVDETKGSIIQITGSQSASSVYLPSSPKRGTVLVIENEATAAWTLNGNGKTIDGSATVAMATWQTPKTIAFDGTEWKTVGGVSVEVGTFIPVIQTASGDLVLTYSVQSGKYTRIGDLVIYQFRIAYSAKSGGTAGDNVRVGGFPFTPAPGVIGAGLVSLVSDMCPGVALDLGSISTDIVTVLKSGGTPAKVSDLAGGMGPGLIGEIAMKISG